MAGRTGKIEKGGTASVEILKPLTVHFGDELVSAHDGISRHVIIDLLKGNVCAVFTVINIEGKEALVTAGAGTTSREDIEHIADNWNVDRIIRAIETYTSPKKPVEELIKLIKKNSNQKPKILSPK